MTPRSGRPRAAGALWELAKLYGLQASFRDTAGRTQRASAEGAMAVLRSLGVPVERPEDASRLATNRARELCARPLDPVLVAWDGGLQRVTVRIPAADAEAPLCIRLDLEAGQGHVRWAGTGSASSAVTREVDAGGARFVELSIPPTRRIPLGYHRLHLTVRRREATAMVVSAPTRAPQAPNRTWGVFVPLYAVTSRRSWGVGDFTDLQALLSWVAGLGGKVVATLPLLAAFMGEAPFEPSPYSPASRLFWNELYLDVTKLPEVELSPEAGRLIRSAAFRREVEALRRNRLVDYHRALAAKRRVLEACARSVDGRRRDALRRFAREHPAALDYARFRATTERHRKPWSEWPAAERDGGLTTVSDPAVEYHLYAQWTVEEQLRSLAHSARAVGAGLSLDLPLGVHPAGYDVWRERDAFALDVDAGAPPDSFFSAGQNWAFPPLHPDRIREQEYRYPIACLRTLLRHATVVRIDHVMGLHRLFWVPRGFDPSQGVYVRYRPEEMYAILSLEAHRHGTIVLGEDLGTVPTAIRRAMARHGAYRSYMLQEELTGELRPGARRPPPRSVAALNTHDMPTFAAFWRAKDIDLRRRNGWLSHAGATVAHRRRRELTGALLAYLRSEGLLTGRGLGSGTAFEKEVLRACLAFLAKSPSEIVIVTLEDLWLETDPQNVPGTIDEHANWRRRGRFGIEEFRGRAEVVRTLEMVAASRTMEKR